MLMCRLTSLICCSSQNPSSRSRCEISGGVESCLMRTAVPATTRLNGQRKGSFVQPFSPKQLDIKPFTVRTKLLLVRLSCKNQNSCGRHREQVEPWVTTAYAPTNVACSGLSSPRRKVTSTAFISHRKSAPVSSQRPGKTWLLRTPAASGTIS
jgi:hypothetical protein